MDRLMQSVIDNWILFSIIAAVLAAMMIFNLFTRGSKGKGDQKRN